MDESEHRIERVPTYAFGREFVTIPEHVRQDLFTLERERAIYTDHWIEEIGDFSHVRITFTEEEAQEYGRRCWAYELFLQAGAPTWARDAPGIDAEVAADADSYELHSVDGTSEPPPYHCFAAFLGPHLEALTCGGLPDRRTVIELQGREALLFNVRRAIDSLTPTIRSFNSREKGLAPWTIEREDDVRDLMFVMLRPLLFDLVKEEPVPSRGGTHKLVDLCSKALGLFVEIKWIGRHNQWRRIVDEIHIDTQCYITHPACQSLIFVVVDTVRDVPDPRQLEHELTSQQTIDGKNIDVQVHVAEP